MGSLWPIEDGEFAVRGGAQSQLEPKGIKAYAVHPGGIMTDLQREMSKEEFKAFGWVDDEGRITTDSRRRQAALHCRVVRDIAIARERSGVYREDRNIAAAVPADDKSFAGVRPWAIDPEAAKRLWSLSEKLLGETFAIQSGKTKSQCDFSIWRRCLECPILPIGFHYNPPASRAFHHTRNNKRAGGHMVDITVISVATMTAGHRDEYPIGKIIGAVVIVLALASAGVYSYENGMWHSSPAGCRHEPVAEFDAAGAASGRATALPPAAVNNNAAPAQRCPCLRRRLQRLPPRRS